MNKGATPSINPYRTGEDLVSMDPAQLALTNQELQARIQEQNRLIIELSESANHTEELEKLKVRLRDARKEIAELKQANRELTRILDMNFKVDAKEYYKIKNELTQLKESQRARIKAERAAEREQVQDEFSQQREGWQRMFTCLERLATKTLSTLADHEAKDEEAMKIARRLRTMPNDLRSKLAMDEITFQDAFEQLAPTIYAAAAKISTFKKLGLPTTWNEHRARVLLFVLSDMEEITTADAIKVIYGDEGRILHRKDVLRAMRKAATLEPYRCLFAVGSNGMRSTLKWIGGSRYCFLFLMGLGFETLPWDDFLWQVATSMGTIFQCTS